MSRFVIALTVLGLVAELLTIRLADQFNLVLSGVGIFVMAAATYGTAGAALIVGVVPTVAGFAVERLTKRPYRVSSLFANVTAFAVPGIAAGLLFHALTNSGTSNAVYTLALVGVCMLDLILNAAITAISIHLRDGVPIAELAAAIRKDGVVGNLFEIAFVVLTVVGYRTYGLSGLLVGLVTCAAWAYMANLVRTARRERENAEERARQYASLSWGTLAGLVRALGARDERAARHGAAVARLARAIATLDEMTEREIELAHIAGLLHDIGMVTLPDHVLNRGNVLDVEDWRKIHRHPEIGAELLRDVALYGPIGEIVLSHHERIDGDGYPRGLAGEEIPAVARIIAVCEVYDVLTGPDTHRQQVSSFEALQELRDVSGTQLDTHYVELLGDVLAGQSHEFRHAVDVDADAEFDLHARIRDAVDIRRPALS